MSYIHTYIKSLRPRGLFSLARSTISRYKILGFPIDSHVKIYKCHNFVSLWEIVKINLIGSIPVIILSYIVYKHRIEDCGGGVGLAVRVEN